MSCHSPERRPHQNPLRQHPLQLAHSGVLALMGELCDHSGMEITEAQYERIAPRLPVQRGNVSVSNLQMLNAMLYMAEHGRKRELPNRPPLGGGAPGMARAVGA